MTKPYDVAHISELDELPVDDEGLTWRPVRRRFDVQAFGVNAYTAKEAGQRVLEEHRETDGPEELYFVATGRATFTLGDDTVDAPAGTFVFVRPGTVRGAVAAEADTTLVAVGAKAGEAYTPSAWEWTFVAGGNIRLGRIEEGLGAMREGIAKNPDAWQGPYNLACFLARLDRNDEALESLARAVELGGDEIRGYAEKDSDFDSIRDHPRYAETMRAQ